MDMAGGSVDVVDVVAGMEEEEDESEEVVEE